MIARSRAPSVGGAASGRANAGSGVADGSVIEVRRSSVKPKVRTRNGNGRAKVAGGFDRRWMMAVKKWRERSGLPTVRLRRRHSAVRRRLRKVQRRRSQGEVGGGTRGSCSERNSGDTDQSVGTARSGGAFRSSRKGGGAFESELTVVDDGRCESNPRMEELSPKCVDQKVKPVLDSGKVEKLRCSIAFQGGRRRMYCRQSSLFALTVGINSETYFRGWSEKIVPGRTFYEP
jgi:hypothetical protein